MLSTANLMSLISQYGSQREERALPFGNTTKEMVKDTIEQIVAELDRLLIDAVDHGVSLVKTSADYNHLWDDFGDI